MENEGKYLYEMELEDTVELMKSKDFKDRLRAEFLQLCIRISKLEKYLETNESDLLDAQLEIMKAYRSILKERFQKIHLDVFGYQF